MSEKTENWVFFSALPPFRGGIAKFSAHTLNALRRSRNVSAYTFKKQYPDFLFPGSSQYDLSAPTADIQRTGSTFNPFSYLRSGVLFRRARPKVFVTSYWMTFMAPMMVCWAYLLPRGTKKIAIIHNLVPHEKRFFDRIFNRLFLNAYDAFVVLSDAVQQDVLALKPTAKVAVLGHPPYETEGATIAPAEAKKQLGLDPQKKTILFFGLIRPYKGLLELIEAFALLDDSYQLLIAGEVYGDAQPYKDRLARLPFRNWKFENGYIPEQEVALYFCAADLVVLPYLSATQSGIRAMALAQKKAVLCTNVGGLAENLESQGHGFELQDTEPRAFSVRMQTLFNQGDIEKCNSRLTDTALQLDAAWLQFAKGLIDLAEEA